VNIEPSTIFKFCKTHLLLGPAVLTALHSSIPVPLSDAGSTSVGEYHTSNASKHFCEVVAGDGGSNLL